MTNIPNYKQYLGTFTEREKKIKDILNFENYDAPTYIKPNEEILFATKWQIEQIENIFKEGK